METLHLLVVDDEPALGAAVARVLKKYTIHVPEVDLTVGYDIAYADTGEKAIEVLDDSAPDLLLLDHKLPGISGLDILNHISDPSLDMLTIMITAYATLENAVAATRRGAYDFLAKPFTPEELKATIYRATKHLLLCRQAEKLAREKRSIRFEFISVLAHELKAPLAAIEQLLDIVLSADPEEDTALIRELTERSLTRVQGMRKLILDLLDVTRLESGHKPRKMICVDLVNTASQAVENMAGSGLGLSIIKKIASLYNGDVTLESTPGSGTIFTVTLDTSRIQRPAE
jgi:signal transduction histidine kinase